MTFARLLILSIALGAAEARAGAWSLQPPEVPVQAPFETPLPWTLGAGDIEIAGGVLLQRGAHPAFSSGAPGTGRDVQRLDLVDVSAGVGGAAEARLQFGLQRAEEEDGAAVSGVQDARLTFSLQLPIERPALALAAVVKLPNAPEEERLGTNVTDVLLVASAGTRAPQWGWAGGAGLAILGSPREPAVQDDVLVFGAAAWRRLAGEGTDGAGTTLFGEVAGQAASRLGNDARVARAGLILTRRLTLAVAARRGLTSVSEDWGVEARLVLVARPRRP